MDKSVFWKLTNKGVCLLFVLNCTWVCFAEPFEGSVNRIRSKPVIVIDPGHGGHAFGVRGPEKGAEKNITLEMANELASCLENAYHPILTRTDDYWLDIPVRTSIANHHKAALFLSVHTGGSFLHKADGITIYYYDNKAQSQEESKAISDFSETGDSTRIPWDDVQTPHQVKSKLLAETIHAEMIKNQDLPESKIYESPLMVLSGADMPCVLIEIGYLTNPVTEKKMGDKRWLSNFAREICKGIDAYFKKETTSHLGLQ